MQDLKRQSNRRPAVRRLRTSSTSVRKNRSNPIPGLPVKLRKPNADPGYRNSWVPSYFVENEPAFLRMKAPLADSKNYWSQWFCFYFMVGRRQRLGWTDIFSTTYYKGPD